MQALRPKRHLAVAGDLYRGAWQQIDEARVGQTWPGWSFLPLAEAVRIVERDSAGIHQMPRTRDAARLAVLAAWRVTQGVYRFDSEVYQGLITTPLGTRLPVEVLMYLPEWGVYLETPGLEIAGSPLHGVFASLEWSQREHRSALNLLIDSDAMLMPLLLPLDQENIVATLAAAIRSQRLGASMASDLAPIMSLLLYLCSTNADLGEHRPMRPVPVKTKRGPRLFPPDHPEVVEVGYRLGSVIREAQAQSERLEGGGTGLATSPHIRRAHWHTYWLGPRDGDRAPDVRWLPPIPVNMRDQLPQAVTIRRVG